MCDAENDKYSPVCNPTTGLPVQDVCGLAHHLSRQIETGGRQAEGQSSGPFFTPAQWTRVLEVHRKYAGIEQCPHQQALFTYINQVDVEKQAKAEIVPPAQLGLFEVNPEDS